MNRLRRGHGVGLSTDPQAAFHARARRDRRTLVRLAAEVERQTVWHRAAAPLARMESVAHGLAGASGVFGFTSLGEDAARLERLLERWRVRPPAAMSDRRLVSLRQRLRPLLEKLARVGAAAC